MGKAIIVDDEEDFLDIMEDIVHSFGYEVETAASGEEAIRKIQDAPADLMLLDLRMPGMGGLETLIRARKIQPALKTLVITAVPEMPLLKQELLKAGASGWMPKPLNLEHLRKWLSAHQVLSGEFAGV